MFNDDSLQPINEQWLGVAVMFTKKRENVLHYLRKIGAIRFTDC